MDDNNFKKIDEVERTVIEVYPKRKKCFVITPIGEDNSPIRRHIDGVINAAIKPALDKEYDVKVAHEITSPGSINKQVIIEIYNSDLVIANLTDLNPNVMYELAIRHALKKPVIMIMEKGNNAKLPFDIVAERTIFYINDFQGVLDLKENIIEAEKSTMDDIIVSNPIYDALSSYAIDESLIKSIETKEGKESANLLKTILDRLNQLEFGISKNPPLMSVEVKKYRRISIELEYNDYEDISDIERIQGDIMRIIKNNLSPTYSIVNELLELNGISFELEVTSKDFNAGININIANTIKEYIKKNENNKTKVTKFKVN